MNHSHEIRDDFQKKKTLNTYKIGGEGIFLSLFVHEICQSVTFLPPVSRYLIICYLPLT